MWVWLSNNAININTITNCFTAVGTVGAVILSLYFATKNRPKLHVNGHIYITFPDKTEHVELSCTNVSSLPINCTGFSIYPNKFRNKGLRIWLISTKAIESLSTPLPKVLQHSDKIKQCFELSIFDNKTIYNFLPKYKWLAKYCLKRRWKIIANTTIKNFEANLSNDLVELILSFRFKEQSIGK